MLGAPGSNSDPPCRPHRARPRHLGKSLVDRRGQMHQRDTGILADRHARRARMVLHALEHDAEPMAADDGGDDADAPAGILQFGALLDMRLEIAAIARGIDHGARTSGEPGLRQRIAQCRAVAIAARIDLRLGQQPAEGTAADERAEMALLIGPRRDIDAAAERARDLQAVDHAQRAIQPAGMRLRLDMAAEQQMRAVAARAADDVADAVDLRLEPGLGHPRRQPVSRLHVLGRIGRPMHAGLVFADLAQRVEIGEQPVAVDACRHGASVIPCGRINPSGVGVKPDTLSDSAHSHFA